jgi:hypothetical protein
MMIFALIKSIRILSAHFPHHAVSAIAFGSGHVLHWAHSALKIGNGGVTWTLSHNMFWDVVGLLLMLHGLVEVLHALRLAWQRLRTHIRSRGRGASAPVQHG